MASFIKKFVANSRIVHNLVSVFVNLLPDFITHNFSKHSTISKCMLNLNYDNIEGFYCEFGCFSGASINHALRTHKKFSEEKKVLNYLNRKFYGFDSFSGFPDEVHPEYKSKNFKTTYEFVKKLENEYKNCKIIKGYFDDVLSQDRFKNFESIAFAFVDCDIYISAVPVFNFISHKLAHGSYLMIDDCYNIDKNGKSIFQALKENENLFKKLIYISNYGLNGAVFKYYEN